VRAERIFQDWKAARARALAYLDALHVPADEREALVGAAAEEALRREHWLEGADATAETLRSLRAQVMERYPPLRDLECPAGDDFLKWRLDAAMSARFAAAEAPRPPGRTAAAAAVATPPLARRHMVPERIERRFVRRLFGRRRNGVAAPAPDTPLYGSPLRRQRRALPWTRVAHRRRALLTVLVLLPSLVASLFMMEVLPHQGATGLEKLIVAFFGALFGWISIGFWTALMGFFVLIAGRDRFAITRTVAPDEPFAPEGLTAVVMPICNEPVDRVFAGLQAIHRSLERTGAQAHFHFFVLSDSFDPSTAVKEEQAWFAWSRAADGFGRLFYRRRKVRQKRKSGNVADFCRRWGQRYRYMIMLDADSLMAGSTLVRLVQLMDRNPAAGMIQTAPAAVNRRSLFARVQQFTSRVYGPMFAAGLHYWQLGDGQYWGHNTIIRVAPFMDHCALPRLPGTPPLGGEIMSHDFVEAALMGRAGWNLWLAYDLDGSYEEVPSTLLEEMARDRRWCQGNLQHLRLLFTEGLFGAHRALFINGVLSYVSALLWFGFLVLSTAEAIRNALTEPEYFPAGGGLFPEWPVWRPEWALALLGVTAAILFLPKLLSVLLVVVRGERRLYGGALRLGLSVFIEILLSSLLAPVRMTFHSRFVVQNLLTTSFSWRSQEREDAQTGWSEAIRRHGVDTLVATVWGSSLYLLNPDYFWWVTPIIAALLLSIPVSVYTSRVRWGNRARRLGLFVIPEEIAPPPELQDLHEYLRAARAAAAPLPPREQDGFVHAAVDPYANAVHRSFLRRRRSLRPRLRAARRALLQRALHDGPAALSPAERRLVLNDPDLTDALHEQVWALADREQAARWGRPGRGSEGRVD
jgi:membrane glycosyltransferase